MRLPRARFIAASVCILFCLLAQRIRAQQPPAGGIPQLIQSLRAIPVPGDPSTANQVPPQARPLLQSLKQQLRDLIAHSLENGPVPDPSAVLSGALGPQGLQLDGEKPDYSAHTNQHFAQTVSIHVERPANNPRLLTVETSIGVACGDDSSLYVFGANGAGWRNLLALEADSYDDVSGANGHFSFSISPPDRGGHWYALAAHMGPQCASLWRPMSYEVLKPTHDPWHPNILLNGSETARWDHDLTTVADLKTLQVHFIGSMHLESVANQREHILNFQLKGDTVLRVGPLAWGPEEFVDEWLDLNWQMASAWSDKKSRDRLYAWHERLGGERRNTYSSEIISITTCGNRELPRIWQVAFALQPGPNSMALPAKAFAIVENTSQDTYYLQDIAAQPSPQCAPGGVPAAPN
jgi:hypothetical protein